MLPTPAEVLAAGFRLRDVIVRTPLRHVSELGDVYLKCENLQRTGSFKLRGAYNALAALTPEERGRGIVASSAGNHGLGVAHSARLLGIRARIFIPASAPSIKREGILALGAEVDVSRAQYDDAHHAAVEYGEANGMRFVNPCAGEPLIAGQGTVGVEILEELPDVATMLVPVGGGGLVGGIATIVRAVAPNVRIIGVQSDRANAMACSLAAGHRVDVPVPPTLADGLAGQIDDIGFAIGRFAVDDMIVVDEAEIAAAIQWIARTLDMRVEGSGACTVAALRRLPVTKGRVAAVLSGGNIDDGVWTSAVSDPGSAVRQAQRRTPDGA